MNWQPVAKAPMEPDASVTFEANTYLVTDGHSVATCDFARGNGAGKPWADWSMYGGIGAGRITHWMPLPAAPGAPAVHESFEDRISDWAHGDALDAARYRWLRDNATRSGVNIDIGAGVEISETLDAAVDDAMLLTAAKESP
jgi:hypothetical protein